jgi:hypothetical protein
MCHTPVSCEHPEKLKGRPGECSPEQVKECHGAEGKHPCSSEAANVTEAEKK